jgi:hypothetical protein
MNRIPKDKSQKREITVKIREKIEEINNPHLLSNDFLVISSLVNQIFGHKPKTANY